jgi:hypothetical protein
MAIKAYTHADGKKPRRPGSARAKAKALTNDRIWGKLLMQERGPDFYSRVLKEISLAGSQKRSVPQWALDEVKKVLRKREEQSRRFSEVGQQVAVGTST